VKSEMEALVEAHGNLLKITWISEPNRQCWRQYSVSVKQNSRVVIAKLSMDLCTVQFCSDLNRCNPGEPGSWLAEKGPTLCWCWSASYSSPPGHRLTYST
jgi:hypothetical protein